jgi:hypothetical protein
MNNTGATEPATATQLDPELAAIWLAQDARPTTDTECRAAAANDGWY